MEYLIFKKNKIYMVGCGGQSMQKLLDEYRQAVQVAEVEYLLMLRIIHQIMLVKTTGEYNSKNIEKTQHN